MSRITLAGGLLTSLVAVSLSAGCLRRDVAAEEPTTKISFDTVVPQPAIDKVDVIVMVDNSSSMADKQRILADAVPDLVRGLVQPKCVDKKTRAPSGTLADPLKAEGGQCPGGTEPAFPPITDMHIGVISSSLGGMGAKTCARDENGRDNDDKGHLLARGADGKSVAEAGELGFLAWYPDVEQNKNKTRHPDPPVPASGSIDSLSNAFKQLVVGVGQHGCGLEAQLESVYRFLVQPDPWTNIAVDPATQRASYGPKTEVDVDLLRQRAAFLRPDSLVAVILLTDEDDSSADPLSFGGSGWVFGDDVRLSRGTSTCATEPASPSCTSCELVQKCDTTDASCAKLKNDPACAAGGGVYSDKEDSLNVRFHEMKRRFGVDPQYPISRYVDAFTKNKVPRRDSEHQNGAYAAKADCTNPLFAAHLPTEPNEDLCKLPRGPRTSDLVYFAIIGGVPNQLLPDSGESAAIDWTKLLGKDPAHYDETGIDTHMIPSTDPRAGLPGPDAADNADPMNGREWATGGTDLQFACTFDLYENEGGKIVPTRRACPKGESCDCDGKRDTPLCAPDDKNVQVRGKAYPTRRELMVAKELGDHAIVASLCPKQLTAPDKDDYGYRPAVRSITRRLEDTLTASCLPRALEREGADGPVPCLVLATLPEPGSQDACAKLGLGVPRADLLAKVRERAAIEDGEESRLLPVCEVPQVAVRDGESCRDDDQKQGFCYAANVPGVRCSQSINFTKLTSHIAGARFSLQCITLDGK
ncbi:MAG: hypothetical protein JWP87_4011 [Labilithrix sp.]|nr:hypothetical protein [Labilithrix sp.]